MQPKRPEKKPRGWLAGGSSWFVVTLLGITFVYWMLSREPTFTTLKYGELMQVLAAARSNPNLVVQKVQVNHGDIRGEIVATDPSSDGDKNNPQTQTVTFRALRVGLETDLELPRILEKSVGSGFQGGEEDSALRSFASVLTAIFMFGIVPIGLLLAFRWMSGGGSPFSFGRSKAKLHAQKDLEVSFQDVAGIDEAVAELREVVDFLKTPEKYQALGGRIPKGVLLVGPPGTGKTLLARAVAGEADVPFFSLSGSDFVEMFVGVGAARVRDLFFQAESKAPCIVFIDELDAMGKTRAGAVVGGHDEREQTLNQLLVEMDGFESNKGVIIMAATNRPETLDPALMRPGRFDRTVVVDRPDINGREAILKVHVRNVKLGPDADLRRVAALTPGSAGADLANLVNEAALMAARSSKEAVTMADLNEAIERSAIGLERKSRIMLPEEKRRVAYHEAGHALVSCSLPNTDAVHKISIIPRGVGVGGYVLHRPEDDRLLTTQSELENQIKVFLGGTIAEELIFKEISTGATNDLERCTYLARAMVTQFGMSQLGRVSYHEGSGSPFLGNAGGTNREFSEETAREIDLEVRKIMDGAVAEVRGLLEGRRTMLETIAKRLVEKETMEGQELREILDGKVTEPMAVSNGAPA